MRQVHVQISQFGSRSDWYVKISVTNLQGGLFVHSMHANDTSRPRYVVFMHSNCIGLLDGGDTTQ